MLDRITEERNVSARDGIGSPGAQLRGGKARSAGTRTRRLRPVLTTTGAVAIFAVAPVALVWASFSATTSSGSNSFSSATVSLTDDDLGSTMFTLSGLQPGDTASRCISVTYNGPATPIRFYGTTTGSGLAAYLALTVTRGTIPPGSFSGCGSFTPDSNAYLSGQSQGVVYAGTLQGYPDSYSAAIKDTLGTPWADGETHAYKFQVALGDHRGAEGKNVTQEFTWEAAPAAKYYHDAVLATSGLVSYWRLDEPSGTAAPDSKGTNTGTYAGGPLLAQLPPLTTSGGKSITLDGVNDFVDVGTPATLQTADFTLEAWFKSTASGAVQTLYRSHPYGQALSITSTGKVRGEFNDATTNYNIVSPSSYNDGLWHHVAYAKGPTQSKLYVDGAEVASVSAAASVHYATTGTSIGRDGDADSNYFSGSLDEVAYYDVALTASQVQAHYDAR